MAMPRSRRSSGLGDRGVATVLFTDIVGSTELANELGDRRWRQVLAMHHAFVRGLLKRHGGHEVDTAGDGFFATFDQPAAAVRCASEAADGLWSRGLRIRAGIHVGEVERTGPKVGGMAVHIGSRVASTAEPGEIRVSSTVRDLVVGSDLRFLDRGSCVLKGVPGEWRLYAIAREAAPAGTPPEPPPPLPADLGELTRRWFQRPAVILPVALAVLAGAVLAFTQSLGDDPVAVRPGPNTAGRLDPTTDRFVAAVSLGGEPGAIVEGDGSLWALNVEAGTVLQIDPASNEVVATRDAGGTPTALAYGDGSLWVTVGFGVSGGGDGAVQVLEIGTRNAPDTIEVGSGLQGIAFGFGSVWVANKIANTVVRIDAGTRSVVKAIDVGEGPEGVAVGAGAVWVANSIDGTVSRIDPETQEVSPPIRLREPYTPNAIAATDDAVWVASTASGGVVRIDPDDASIVTTIDVPSGPVAISATTGGVWVTCSAAGALVRIDPRTNERAAPIPVGGTPWGVAATGGATWITVRA
jgi:YVTN family beta-propeller protein